MGEASAQASAPQLDVPWGAQRARQKEPLWVLQWDSAWEMLLMGRQMVLDLGQRLDPRWVLL